MTVTNVATAYVADHVIRSKPAAGSIPGGQVLSKEGKWDGRQITWSIHINKQEMPQNHVIITDLLPVGQEFTGTVTVSDEGQPGGVVELYRFGGEEPESTMAVELEGKEKLKVFTEEFPYTESWKRTGTIREKSTLPLILVKIS